MSSVKADGPLVTWGDPNGGGDSSRVQAQLADGVTQVYSTKQGVLDKFLIAQKPAFEFDATSLPFPNGPPGNILALDETLPPEEAIRVIGVWLLRFHPDKFVIGVGPGEFYGADGLAATQVPHELSQLWWVIAVGYGLPRPRLPTGVSASAD